MKEEKATLQKKVGTFVGIGLLILLVSLFLIGEDSALLTDYYYVKTRLPQVQGLRPGSVISLAGIKVGNVSEISFIDDSDLIELELAVKDSYKARLRQDSKVSVRTQGALGDKYVYITSGSSSKPQVEEYGLLKQEIAGDILGTITERGQEIEKVFDILNEMHILMKRINGEERSEHVMSNLVESSHGLKDVLDQTKELVLDLRTNMAKNKDMTRSLRHLSSIMEKIDKGEGTLGALVNDPSLHSSLKNIFGGSPRTRHLKSLIRSSIQKSEEVQRSQ